MLWLSFAFAAELVAIPGTQLSLPTTSGFRVETRWAGTGNAKTSAAVAITMVPAPRDTVLPKMTHEVLLGMGVIVRTEAPVVLDGHSGTWFEGDNASGGVFALAIVGDDEHTWIMKATAPNTKKLGPAVDQLRGAVWTRYVAPELAFSVPAPAGMAEAFAISGAQMFSVGGVMVSEPAQPMFVVAPSIRPVSPTEATARQMAASVTGLEGVVVQQCTHLTRAGRDRYDLVAEGVDVGNAEGVGKGTPMTVWQRVYYSGNDYLRALAVAPTADRARWEPAFLTAMDVILWQPPGAAESSAEIGYSPAEPCTGG